MTATIAIASQGRRKGKTMAGLDRIQKRFDELAAMANKIAESKSAHQEEDPSGWRDQSGRTVKNTILQIDKLLFIQVALY